MNNLKNPPYELIVKPTPWDSKVFNLKTYEIELEINALNAFQSAVDDLNSLTLVNEPSLYYSRVDSNNKLNKAALIRSGFFCAETQLKIVTNLTGNTVPKEIGSRRLPIMVANKEDYDDVCEHALKTFDYSRFHEDPFIDNSLSNLRMKAWCLDMRDQAFPLLVSRGKNGDLDSFIFYRLIDQNRVELVLGGSLPGKGALTPVFWASFLDYFRALNLKFVETRISASNISIANIYLFFGFKVKSVFLDFHKHVNCGAILCK